jgi:hypothetical protein
MLANHRQRPKSLVLHQCTDHTNAVATDVGITTFNKPDIESIIPAQHFHNIRALKRQQRIIGPEIQAISPATEQTASIHIPEPVIRPRIPLRTTYIPSTCEQTVVIPSIQAERPPHVIRIQVIPVGYRKHLTIIYVAVLLMIICNILVIICTTVDRK